MPDLSTFSIDSRVPHCINSRIQDIDRMIELNLLKDQFLARRLQKSFERHSMVVSITEYGPKVSD